MSTNAPLSLACRRICLFDGIRFPPISALCSAAVSHLQPSEEGRFHFRIERNDAGARVCFIVAEGAEEDADRRTTWAGGDPFEAWAKLHDHLVRFSARRFSTYLLGQDALCCLALHVWSTPTINEHPTMLFSSFAGGCGVACRRQRRSQAPVSDADAAMYGCCR